MCTHSIDDPLPHAPLRYAATGEMVKGSLSNNLLYYILPGGRGFNVTLPIAKGESCCISL